MRALRLAVHRRAIVAAIAATWPADPEHRTDTAWQQLHEALSSGVDRATVRNRTRQVAAFVAVHGRLPVGLCELERPPRIGGQVLLAAADRQQVRLERSGTGQARLWVQLPRSARPAAYSDWAWHALEVRLPPTVPAAAKLCTPTLRPVDGMVRVDLPFERPVTPAPLTGHTRAVGADWGINTLLTATVACLDPDGVVTSHGRPLRYDAAGIALKIDRLRHQREQLSTKIVRLQQLTAGHTRHPDPRAEAKLALLEQEHDHVRARIRHLGKTLAWSAARWLLDQAMACAASVIYVEDLATLEAGQLTRTWNRRISNATRGSLQAALRHLAAGTGIAVVTVPARGTSAGCPRCGAKLRHLPAPNRSTERGYRWAICCCGHTADRDFSAAQRIAGRGLAGQMSTRRDRAGHLVIRTITDVPVRRGYSPKPRPPLRPALVRDRRKTGPTPKRHARPTGRDLPPSPILAAPATAGSRPGPLGSGQRPAGRTPQNPATATPAARNQVPGPRPTTSSSNRTPTRNTHRAQRAVLGRGFHHQVTTTPILAIGPTVTRHRNNRTTQDRTGKLRR